MQLIPISKVLVDKIIAAGNTSPIILTLEFDELAALSIIQLLPALHAKEPAWSISTKVDAFLYKFIEGSKDADSDLIHLEVAKRLNITTLTNGAALMPHLGIAFMTDADRQKRVHLDSHGNWIGGEKQTDFIESEALLNLGVRNYRVTSEQERYVNRVLRDRDEPIAFEGYAGTGKSTMIAIVSEGLGDNNILFLAMTRHQLTTMLSKVSGTPHNYTFARLFMYLLESNLVGAVRKINTRYYQKGTTLQHYVDALGCLPLGTHSAQQVAKAAIDTVYRFCHSPDGAISLSHVKGQFTKSNDSEKMIIAAHAMNLWDQICIPKDNLYLPITNEHIIKAAALYDITIPEKYKQVIIDEAHNLPAPVIQILEKSYRTASFSFGDKYQHLGGMSSLFRRRDDITRQLSHSVRVGDNTSDIYNMILAQHPIEPTAEFHGTRSFNTKVIHYSKFKIPEQYSTIIVDKLWSALNIALRLKEGARRFRFSDRTGYKLKELINAAIAFHLTKDNSAHSEFYGYSSWDEYVQIKNDRAIDEVDSRIRSGFEYADIAELVKNRYGLETDIYIVSLVPDVLNQEFDRVAIFADMVGSNGVFDRDISKTINKVYTGISRAKYELIIPKALDGLFMDQW